MCHIFYLSISAFFSWYLSTSLHLSLLSLFHHQTTFSDVFFQSHLLSCSILRSLLFTIKKKKTRQSHVSVKSCRNQISLDVIWPRIGSGGGRISWVAHSGNPQPTATWTACTTAGTPTARTPTAGTPTAVCLVISTAVWQWEQQSLWQLSPVRQLYCFM